MKWKPFFIQQINVYPTSSITHSFKICVLEIVFLRNLDHRRISFRLVILIYFYVAIFFSQCISKPVLSRLNETHSNV